MRYAPRAARRPRWSTPAHRPELVAAHPARDVGGADHREHPLCGLGEHCVTGQVADAVVDRLEIVEVQDDQREPPLVALGAGDLTGERLVEETPVVEAGEASRSASAACLCVLAARSRAPARRGSRAVRTRRSGPRRGLPAERRERAEVADRLAVRAHRQDDARADARGEDSYVVDPVAVDDLDRSQVVVVRQLDGRLGRLFIRDPDCCVSRDPSAASVSSRAASTPAIVDGGLECPARSPRPGRERRRARRRPVRARRPRADLDRLREVADGLLHPGRQRCTASATRWSAEFRTRQTATAETAAVKIATPIAQISTITVTASSVHCSGGSCRNLWR